MGVGACGYRYMWATRVGGIPVSALEAHPMNAWLAAAAVLLLVVGGAMAAGDNDPPPTPVNLSHEIGTFWVNHTWEAGSGPTPTDSYNVSVNGTWHNGTTNTYFNNTLSDYGDWSNISVYAFSNTYGLSYSSVSEDVQLPLPIPASPTAGSPTWGSSWVNHTWTEGSCYGLWCGTTDSYNVSINGTWHNGTTDTYFNNTGLSPGSWSNAIIYAFNNTGGINETYISQNVHIPSGNTWDPNSTIINGLTTPFYYTAPDTFYMSSTLYLISGDGNGVFTGWNWTGSTWQSDSAITSGLGDVGGYSTPTIFQKDGTWYLISGEQGGTFFGFNWTGSSWQSDSAITSGLGDVGDQSALDVFQKDGTWYLIAGEVDSVYNGFNWTGSAWQSDSTITSGLGSPGGGGWYAPRIFEFSGVWYCVVGLYDGTWAGYNYWTGSAWQSDSTLISGLIDTEYRAKPTIFTIGDTYYLITGRNDGTFDGYNGNLEASTAPTPVDLAHEIGTFWVNHTWAAESCVITTDSYNVSINGTWHNGTTNTYFNNTLSDYGDWSNISVYAFNNTYGLSYDPVSEDVQLPLPIPAVPIAMNSTWDYYWVNHTWTEGSCYGIWCGITDSYNVSINETWHNGTTDLYLNNTGLSPHSWSNITVSAFNNTAGLNETYIYQNAQIANQNVTITNVSDTYSISGYTISVDCDSIDADEDSPLYSCNRTDLFTDFNTTTGVGTWTSVSGIYYINFGVSDGWGSINNTTITLYIMSDPTMSGYTTKAYWVNHTWTIGDGAVVDSYNVSVNGVWHNGTTTNYFKDTLSEWYEWSNISVYSFNNTLGIGSQSATENVNLVPFNPPTPINIAHTIYDCNVTWTWDAGSGTTVTDSYNISISTTICGDTDTDWSIAESESFETHIDCDGALPTIRVYAYNATHGLRNDTPLSETITSIPNIDTVDIDFESGYTLGNLCPQHGWYCAYHDPAIQVLTDSGNEYAGISTSGSDMFSSARYPINGWKASKKLYIFFDFQISGEGAGEDAFAIAPSGWGGSGTSGGALLVIHGTSHDSSPYTTIEVYNGVSTLYSGAASEGWHSIEAVYDGDTSTFTTLNLDGSPISNTAAQNIDDLDDTMYVHEWANMVDIGYSSNRIGIDNIYIYPIGYFACYNCTVYCNTYIQIKDKKDNYVKNSQVSIYDKTTHKYIQHWETEDDGLITLSTGEYKGHSLLVCVKTFDGVYTKELFVSEEGGNTNITLPLNYNIDIRPKDQYNSPLHDVFAGIFEYAFDAPQSWWGSDTYWGFIPITNCTGFSQCDIQAEKPGYTTYTATGYNWTSKSAMIKDYKQDIVMVKE